MTSIESNINNQISLSEIKENSPKGCKFGSMDTQKIVLFDGVCNLCNSSIQKVIENDSKNLFQFASLQSEFGQTFLKKNNLSKDEFSSMVLIDGTSFYTKSDAALRIAKELKGMYKLAGIFLLVPQFLRNIVYDLVANNRYQLFGKRESCWLPTPELKKKFIS